MINNPYNEESCTNLRYESARFHLRFSPLRFESFEHRFVDYRVRPSSSCRTSRFPVSPVREESGTISNRNRKGEEGGKDNRSNDVYTNPERGFFGGAPPRFAPTKYIYTHTRIYTKRPSRATLAHAFSWTRSLRVARGLCPMICSGTIMPQLPDTLTHPSLRPCTTLTVPREPIPPSLFFYEQLATRYGSSDHVLSFFPARKELNTLEMLEICQLFKMDGLFL